MDEDEDDAIFKRDDDNKLDTADIHTDVLLKKSDLQNLLENSHQVEL